MKNWSTEHTKEVKKWLDVDSYRKFEELPLIQLYHELLARTLFFKPYHEEFEAKAVNLYIDRIFSGKPFLITEQHLGYLTREDTLYQPPHFFLTTTERLAQLSIVGLRNSLFSGMEVMSIRLTVNSSIALYQKLSPSCSGIRSWSKLTLRMELMRK